jgi:hypothetical protein
MDKLVYADPPTDGKEAARIHQLPVVVELREDGKTRYFMVESNLHRTPHDPRPQELASFGEIFPEYAHMKALAEKHGKEMKPEELKKGKVHVAIIRGTEDLGYTEYRFDSDANNEKKK